MLVHEVLSTGLVTAKETDTIRFVSRDENDERHSGPLRGTLGALG